MHFKSMNHPPIHPRLDAKQWITAYAIAELSFCYYDNVCLVLQKFRLQALNNFSNSSGDNRL